MRNWNDYLMGFARHAATGSKDETKVGAALIAFNGRSVLLTAYNGPPARVQDTDERFERPEKYLWVAHAESNLISTAARYGIHTAGCSIYTTHMPCAGCARSIIQAGIACVFAGEGKTSMPVEEFIAARQMFEESGVQFVTVRDTPAIRFGSLKDYVTRQWAWSLKTFGPSKRTKGIIEHITKELGEIAADPHDLYEWSDVVILGLDGFWRHGGTPDDLMDILQSKQDKNFARKWPDWRTMSEDASIEHDRTGE